MIRRAALVLTLLSLVIPRAAHAYDLLGVGAHSCGTWIVDRQNANNDPTSVFMDESWVEGFLSGVGFTGIDNADPLNNMDANGVFGWIDNYCQANPIKNIGDASGAFYYAHPK